MNLDIDKLLSGMEGWDLALSIGGKNFIISAPDSAASEALQTMLSADAIIEADRPELEKLIAPLILDPSDDIKTWKLDQLVGGATAIAIHARQIRAAHSRGICSAVVMAMRPTQPAATESEQKA